MGEEVSIDHFEEEDFRRFDQRLREEMTFVRQLFAEGRFDTATRKLGYELELCLLDAQGRPAPVNQSILERHGSPQMTFELAKFNLEINGHAFVLDGGVFQRIRSDMDELYHTVERAAADEDARVGLFGVLPSIRFEHLDRDRYMSAMYRYRLLDERLLTMRGRPIRLDIRGADHLRVEKRDVMFEALGTSLQLHIQIPRDQAVDSYHAALWSTLPALAAGANSPLVLQHRCWAESRIAIFKQAVDTRNLDEERSHVVPRVHLAKGWIGSFLELFEDMFYYSPVLPEVTDQPVEDLHHFCLHNGTIWRWVRPILGRNRDGQYHLRLELRVTPSGPTRIDTLANLVFQVGLVEGLRQQGQALVQLPYEQLERGFYRVARHGLEAEIGWYDGHRGDARSLVLEHALPVAAEGLQQLGIESAGDWLHIIRERVRSGQTGARWLDRQWRRNPDADALVRRYLDLADRNQPVHEWPRT